MKRLRTGIHGLDRILSSGIPEYSSVFIAGAPGTGKTILTQNILHNLAKEAKVLYISTLSEPQIKVIRYQQELTFFDPDAFMKRVIYHDIGGIIRQDGARRGLEEIERLVREHRPIAVAVDSIKAIVDLIGSNLEFREFISDLTVRLAAWECTALFVGEYSEDELASRPETAIADGIFFIYGMEEKKHQKRYLRVLKMRGADYASGEHLLKITKDGVKIYPRLNPVVADQSYLAFGNRQATGVSGLDRMLGGGIPAGATTLIAGSTGTGKTLLGLSWLIQGARENESGMIASFEENPLNLKWCTRTFGWELDSLEKQNLIRFFHFSRSNWTLTSTFVS
ncbi:MAG: ATPase domain-containing protein [Bacillota bacterium]